MNKSNVFLSVKVLLVVISLGSQAHASFPETYEMVKADCQLDWVKLENQGHGFGKSMIAFTGADTISESNRKLQIEVDSLNNQALDLIMEACAKVRWSAIQKSQR